MITGESQVCLLTRPTPGEGLSDRSSPGGQVREGRLVLTVP